MSNRLIRLRDRAQNQIVLILRFAEKINEDTTSVEDIKGRLEVLESRYQTFNELELQLIEEEAYVPITDLVDDIYYKARALLSRACGHYHTQTNTDHDLNGTLAQFIDQQKTFYEGVNISQHVRLPKLDIEKFSGDYKTWASFHDMFVSTVHNNEQISGVHKLQMLKGVLTGEAAALIRHISVTENNYKEAWDKLCSRYKKMTPIISSLVQSFFDQKLSANASGKELRRITENADEIIRGLRALGPKAETRDPWLIHILLNKVDNETRQLWANEAVGKDFPSFDSMLQFLNKRCDALEICDATIKRGSSKSHSTTFIAAKKYNTMDCAACNQQHPIFRCPVFKNQTMEQRTKLMTEKHLCNNCLRSGHTAKQCYSKSSCLICKGRHHTMLHKTEIDSKTAFDKAATYLALNQPTTTEAISKADVDPNIQATNSQVLHSFLRSPTTVLPTAIIYARARTGELQPLRALLDSGSQSSFVTESCAQRLGLKRTQSSTTIYGLASTSAATTNETIDMTIHSRVDMQYTIEITAHIITKITNLLPSTHVNFHREWVTGLALADPHFNIPKKIDLLLGVDVFFKVLTPESRSIDGLPSLQSSKLGWLIAGAVNTSKSKEVNLTAIHKHTIQPTIDEVHRLLHKFWEVDEVAVAVRPSVLPNYCDTYYKNTTTRDSEGRFIVRLPFKETKSSLGSSFEAAHHRLLAMERKFTKMPEFYNSYKEFMSEYIALGHMTHMPWQQIPQQDNAKYYLPHHAVIKASSSTTKLRVVFDGSCKTKSGVSLNDILEVGPNIQIALTNILLNFRRFPIALVADVEKMYRQVNVNADDANFQLILWRNNPTEKIQAYKLNTVTYGTACAPYLAVKSLQSSTQNYECLYPMATNIIKTNFYIDDLLTGCDDITEALELKDQINKILSKSGFILRKWRSNSQEFLEHFSREQTDNIPKLIEDDATIKTLGITWNSESDTFSFRVQQDKINTKWTKRKILSTASKVYDPLGWLSPTIVLFKILLQKIWLLKLEWDAIVPSNIENTWQSMYQTLPALEAIQIPRRLSSISNARGIQLHAFCDASEAAYGCVIYSRATNDIGEISINIVYAKSKVAPIKQITLPRLELCGAALLCKAIIMCKGVLDYGTVDVFAWTDSMIVLHWLSDVPRRWKSFVGNRTSYILETIPRSMWQHVPSKQNPADIISRGIKPQGLANSQLWWKGPNWLWESENGWPKLTSTTISALDIDLDERPKYVNVLLETGAEDNPVTSLLFRHSSWFKIRKIMVYILRFGQLSKGPKNNAITVFELNTAEELMIRNIQETTFNNDYTILKRSGSLPSKNQLSALDPFIDANGLLRVGGRLDKSALKYSARHPVILPKNHRICELIVRDIHYTNMHAGNSLTLSLVRNKYWMIGARNTIKKCLKTCIVCIRHRSSKSEQKMADLPTVRCNQSRPFSKTGLDYAGPIYIKNSKRRNSPVEKAYVAVFVCLVVKAVHLEVVSSLDSESFLAALKRFISRRGLPEEIWCDNGSNFVGANRELQRLKHQIINQSNNPLILEFLLQKSINFHFNPPHAPHFGGLWEATVKSFKYHLKRVTNINQTFEEMTTLLVQIEGLLNSRPLCKMNDDPTDLEILTPAHFLVGESLAAVAEPNFDEMPLNKLSRWQNIQHRLQGFWKRWHRDYLTSLQQRYKWKVTTHKFEVNDVVLIREDNLYPSHWMMGRIINVYPGSDGVVRVATLKTSKGEFKRPVNKLVKLPLKE